MKKQLLEILVCPNCNGKLKLTSDETSLVCSYDKLCFAIVDGIPHMLAEEAKTLSLEEYEQLSFK